MQLSQKLMSSQVRDSLKSKRPLRPGWWATQGYKHVVKNSAGCVETPCGLGELGHSQAGCVETRCGLGELGHSQGKVCTDPVWSR